MLEIRITGTNGYETYKMSDNEIGIRPAWVSVKERLPEEGVKVLAYAESRKEIMIDYIVLADDPLWACRLEIDNIEVTHWMPLPEAPQ